MDEAQHPPELVNVMFLHGLIGRPSPDSPIPDHLVEQLKTQPIGSFIFLPAPSRTWSPDEWDRIALGHVARDMDDKWNSFVDRDRLYLHRSWTGRRMYEAQFETNGDSRKITEALLWSDERYDPMSIDSESLQLEVIVETVLLNDWNVDKIDRLLAGARLDGRLPREGLSGSSP